MEMDLPHGENVSDDEGTSKNRGKRKYHRHTTQQIETLEAYFKACPHPHEKQRRQISRELGLDAKQIKFWFQNKRTQMKTQNERVETITLRSENERFRSENVAMMALVSNIKCPTCNGPDLVEEVTKQLNVQKLSMENQLLKEEIAQTITWLPLYNANPNLSIPFGNEQFSSINGEQFIGEQIPAWNAQNPVPPNIGHNEVDKSMIIKTIATSAMDEIVELLQLTGPVWIKTEGRYAIHHETYDNLFPKPNHFKAANARIESSVHVGEVGISAIQLVQMLVDNDKWMDMFHTIVTKSKTIEVIDTGSSGSSLKLMYEKMHILSPLVAPREFFFIRYCLQLDSSRWVLVDVSYDFMRELQDAAPNRSWKLPSGFMVEDMSNGKSSITWIEHVQVDDKASTQRLYKDLVCRCEAYGAKRWVTIIQRMCERLAFSIVSTTSPKHELEQVIDSGEGRQNLMRLSHRMVKNLCQILGMTDKVDFPNLSEVNCKGVHISFRRSSGVGQPSGLIVTSATSLQLPLSLNDLFNFFKDDKKRHQWDVLSSGNPASEIAHISTGSHPGNCISVIQPFAPKENNLLMLQESSIDSMGGIIIYAPINLQTLSSVVSGEDTTKVPILGSGFIISSDARPVVGLEVVDGIEGAGDSATSKSGGSLLTIAFQVLACCGTQSNELNMESVTNVHSLISSAVEKIKVALNCNELE